MKLGLSCHLSLAILLLTCSFQHIYGRGGRGGGRSSSSSSSRSSSSSSRYSSSSSRYSPSSSSGSSSASSYRYSPSSSSGSSSSFRYSPSSSSGSSSFRYSPSSSSGSSSSFRYSPSSITRYSPSYDPEQYLSSIRQQLSSSSINYPKSNPGKSSSSSDARWDIMLSNIEKQSKLDAEKLFSRTRTNPSSRPSFYNNGLKLTPPPYNPIRQPAYNPNFKELDVGSYNPPIRQPAYNSNFKGLDIGPPPPSYSAAQYAPQPAYNPNFKEPKVGSAPPSYSETQHSSQTAYNPNFKGSVNPYSSLGWPPNYSPTSFQTGQHNILNFGANSALNPGSHLQQPAIAKAYPVQPGMVNKHPAQPAASRPNFAQPGIITPQLAQPAVSKPYPVQPGAAKPYPVQPGMPLGANVWHAQSGIPSPAYMNYGGLPTGTNMHVKPHKKKGFLGSLMSLGKPSYGKPKHYNSFPSPYGVGGFGSTGYPSGLNTFMGKHGTTGTMYTILPYIANKKARKLFKPKIGYRPVFFHRHYHHHHGFHSSYEHGVQSEQYENLENINYAGHCKHPIPPKSSAMACNSTVNEINCQINCSKGYTFPDKSTNKTNKCWHMTGVWRPMKNFPSCEPVCNQSCLNGGKCISPDVCGCKSEYRGPRCEFHYLKCDIHLLAQGSKISWVCSHKKNETTCRVKCKPPAEFANAATTTQEYRCSVDGTWTPSSAPDCVIKEITTESANATKIEVTIKN